MFIIHGIFSKTTDITMHIKNNYYHFTWFLQAKRHFLWYYRTLMFGKDKRLNYGSFA
jgi:hypothetical protein